MAQFVYKVITPQGKEKKGSLEAKSRDAAMLTCHADVGCLGIIRQRNDNTHCAFRALHPDGQVILKPSGGDDIARRDRFLRDSDCHVARICGNIMPVKP